MKPVVKNLGFYFLGFAFGLGAGITETRDYMQKREIEVHHRDVNRDTKEDIEIYNPKTNSHYAFIQKENGTYERAEVMMQDGFPFYYTAEGHYDYRGNFFPKK